MPSKLTQAEFLAKAVAVHGVGRYDYSQAVYTTQQQKIAISCPIHGLFEQSPNKHMQGNGCPACGREKVRLSTLDNLALFIAKAEATHGSKYDYSATVYLPNPQKIAIRCPAHGIFDQTAGEHIAGKGCKKCAVVSSGAKRRRHKSIEVDIFFSIHGKAYDYSKLPERFTSREALPITCPTHGVFMQPHYVHMAGKGCALCGNTTRALARRRTTEEFIAEAHSVHGDKYDYSQANYVLGQQKVTIICPSHGAFEQEPSSHINGRSGCPGCANSARTRGWAELANGRQCTLYFLRFFTNEEEFFKVGITVTSVAQRYKQKSNLASYQYEILAEHKSTDAARIFEWEQSIIETFAHLRYCPKHSFDGATECFSEADPILAIFPL